MARGKDFQLDELLRDADGWATSMKMPGPVQHRLDALVEVAVVKGGEARGLARSEVVAAMILAFQADAGAIRAMLLSYRMAKTRDALVAEDAVQPGANVIWIDRPKAGRRTAR